ncbi:hypothetical protein EMIHUDRAFT_369509 [Emiliania huxleyi CCMP1516]|uniref:PhoD-like phosphatase metallophosphatase domain-containing protein n=2 Tax=Emiliania huxleyi TaxID=2903 RepID=A0A0D3J753_EMIH1|nr:hypothetical protein EMIHUDRAFT_369509 [Emiliania huxleyi CCMP1516]EOD19338.1 hypothetical protein EMIHUDRAFT_369509 [Emiliania huxleyi CCMP1516]|eukprot:XP_005771767.1 hypothetical protein EMIHUDRAFT_369509 [Emiliania huxleyi CCMP1516]
MMVPPPPPPKITDFSQVKFIDELARPDHVKPHFLGVDPLAGEPRLSCRGIEGKNCTKDGDFRSTLGPKLAAEYTEYTHLTVPTGTVHGQPGFYHGVASGSPTTSAVVVWTRYTPASPTDVVPVTLVMDKAGASALSAASPIKMTVMAEAKNDWVIKIDVTHLPAGTDFVYAFIADGKQSMVGMTKTAPDGPTAEMHYALFSCSHWAQGYFHPYDHGSILEKLDWWVHVGDYIYEYGVSTADDFSDRMWGYSAHRWPTKERMDPPWEIVELNDYRRRYAVYHTDHGLQQLRARAPMIATWDDHEITNNWFFQGAQNHQSTCPADATACDEHEGSWVERVNAGAIAYLEWLPIRRGPDDQSGLMNTDIKQVIEWGDLATIVSVDTRGYARSADYVGGWQKPSACAVRLYL